MARSSGGSKAEFLNTALTEIKQENWNRILPDSKQEQTLISLLEDINKKIKLTHFNEYVGELPEIVGILAPSDVQELGWSLEDKLRSLNNMKSKLALTLADLIDKIQKTFDTFLKGAIDNNFDFLMMMRRNIYILKYLYQKLATSKSPGVEPLLKKLGLLMQSQIATFKKIVGDDIVEELE
jgi:hypothetical protein